MNIIIITLLMLFSTNENLRFDFGNEKGNVKTWFTLTDNVMGGVSTSNLSYKNGSIVFSGNVSFENNGGFASFRSGFSKFDLTGYDAVRIRFKSQNQKFALTLDNSRNWWEPNYKYEFQSESSSDWKTVSFDIADFHEEVIGRKTGNSINKNIQKNICQIGIITNDKKEGSFSLEIDYIEFYKK
jgi:NADH dehydrogenase [ubiquinone] 1 alpha subcomplex assembly factor 1